MADRICVMEAGRVVCFDTPQNTARYYLESTRNIEIWHRKTVQRFFRDFRQRFKSLADEAGKQRKRCPLTIREGRLWMQARMPVMQSAEEEAVPVRNERPEETVLLLPGHCVWI